ncbi:MAG: hypothetical protein JRJ49_05515 [Deltaproteobacteria bacterium]|nr:hypothetical protein [Deltaproteobacteria bacterium]
MGEVHLKDIINKSVSEVKNGNKVNIALEFDKTDRRIKTCFFVIKNLFKNLIEYSINNGAKDILIKSNEDSAINQTKGIKILFQSDANRDKKGMWNLLPVFFGVFHCMGDIELSGASDILISLPFDPDKAFIEPAGISYLDDFFEQFEAVKYYETYLNGIK